MPIVTTCPACNEPARVPDNLLGQRVQCARCRAVFTATEAGPSAPERPRAAPKDEFSDPPEPRRRRRRDYEDDDYDDDYDRPRRVRRRRRGSRRIEAESKVVAPGTILQVFGALLCLLGLISLLGLMVAMVQLATAGNGPRANRDSEDAVVGIVLCVLGTGTGFITGPLVILGGTRLKQLRSYGLVMTATIVIMVTAFFTCVPMILVGIWPLILLLDPTVKEWFDRPEEDRTD